MKRTMRRKDPAPLFGAGSLLSPASPRVLGFSHLRRNRRNTLVLLPLVDRVPNRSPVASPASWNGETRLGGEWLQLGATVAHCSPVSKRSVPQNSGYGQLFALIERPLWRKRVTTATLRTATLAQIRVTTATLNDIKSISW
jgi:hypothetical protein